MSVRLTGSHGTWSLPDGAIVIGRARDCQLCIVDPRLSRHHAKLMVKGHEVVLHDLESTNGVLLNGDRHHGKKQLKNGDLIVAGPCTFFLAIDADQPLAARLETLAHQPPAAAQPTPSAPQSDTEAMNPVLDAPGAALPAVSPRLSGDKKLDPAIAALVASGERHPTTDFLRPHDFTPSGKAVIRTPRAGAATLADTERDQRRPPTADSLLPDDLRAMSTSALSDTKPVPPPPGVPGGPLGPSRPRDSQSSEHFRPSDYSGENKALQLVPPTLDAGTETKRRLRWLRLAAGALDGGQAVLLAGALAATVGMLGYALALHLAGALLDGGLPRLPVAGDGSASLIDLAASLLRRGGLARAYELTSELSQLQNQLPFLLVFVAATAAVLAWVLTLLLSTVAATVLKGAPRWHRRFDLLILDRRQGYYLGWGRALLRWFLCALLWPASLVLAPLGVRGLHDLLSGCDVRVRKRRAS